MKNYEIYPLPHDITYVNEVFTFSDEVAIIYDETIDEVTKKKIESVLEKHNLSYRLSEQAEKDQKYIEVRTGSSDAFNHFTKMDAYSLAINEEAISIIGKDTDAAFYSVVTLEAILEQMTDNTIQCLQINDYSNTKIRGVIEGFYGIPWSNEDRASLIEFGGKFKANTFVFAPKDDPYHRERWSELYPEEKLTGIRELAKLGNETKNRFVWTISPLGEVASLAREKGEAAAMDLLEENTEKLIAKFDQLYDVGVRQFGVLGDDIGNLPLDYVVQLMKAVSKWTDEKGDVYDTLYCPASYNSGWAWIPEELNAYEKGFADNIQIFWTGSTTCGPVVQSTIDVFKNKDNEGILRRDPLFWLNWPVNDVDYSRVFLGKGEMLEKNIEDLAGVVTNPMQEAEASKISIFAIADYAWNTESFDDQTSFEDSLKYIEPHATKAFEVIATNMSDAHPNGIQVSESENMKAVIDEMTRKLKNNESISHEADEAIEKLQVIADSVDQFMEQSQNESLKQELDPFVYALRDIALSSIAFIEASLAVDSKNHANAWNIFSKAFSLYEQSKQYDRPMLVGTKKTKPAQKRLQPFLECLKENVANQVAQLLQIEKPSEQATIITNRKEEQQLVCKQDVNQMTLTGMKNLLLEKDEFIGLYLGRVREVTQISQIPENIELEHSVNGIEWEAMNKNFTGLASYVRIKNIFDEAVQLAVDELTVTTNELQPKSLKATNFTDYENALAVLDDDLTTSAYFKEHQAEGKFITYDLGQEIHIENLKIFVGESELDFPRHAVIEGAIDGENWETLMALGNQGGLNEGEKGESEKITAIYDQFTVPYRFKEASGLDYTARYLRFRITVTKVGHEKWMRFQEIMINNGAYYPTLNDPTVEATGQVNRGYEVNHVNDGDVTTYFKPLTDEAGHMIYHVGKIGQMIHGITVLQDFKQAAKGTISVRTVKGWKEIGLLEEAYTYIAVEESDPILDVKIDWKKGEKPAIHQVHIHS